MTELHNPTHWASALLPLISGLSSLQSGHEVMGFGYHPATLMLMPTAIIVKQEEDTERVISVSEFNKVLVN